MIDYLCVVKPCDDPNHDGWIEQVEDETLQKCEDKAIKNVQKAIEQNCDLYVEHSTKM